uniref:Apoptosis regulatory protein Siva n=1 Tax=Clastoptera arizonana TaxID=38151 RepID=A0A1B6C316_9HEMI
MPKRLCPFEDNYAPQMKVLVTARHQKYRNGEGMDIIYEKTKRMLFLGAKVQCLCCKNGNQMPKLNNGNILKNEKLQVSLPCPICHPIFLQTKCFACTQPSHTKCNYCDKSVCEECKAQCSRCDLVFCKDCTFPVYTDPDDKFECYSCFK